MGVLYLLLLKAKPKIGMSSNSTVFTKYLVNKWKEESIVKNTKDPLWGKVVVSGNILGYIEYDQNLHIAKRGLRQSVGEVWSNLGKNEVFCSCKKRPELKHAEIVLETNPIITWDSEVCTKCMSLIGNRMPYNHWETKKERIQKIEGGYYTTKTLYSLPLIGK